MKQLFLVTVAILLATLMPSWAQYDGAAGGGSGSIESIELPPETPINPAPPAPTYSAPQQTTFDYDGIAGTPTGNTKLTVRGSATVRQTETITYDEKNGLPNYNFFFTLDNDNNNNNNNNNNNLNGGKGKGGYQGGGGHGGSKSSKTCKGGSRKKTSTPCQGYPPKKECSNITNNYYYPNPPSAATAPAAGTTPPPPAPPASTRPPAATAGGGNGMNLNPNAVLGVIALLVLLGGIYLLTHRTHQKDETLCREENKRLAEERRLREEREEQRRQQEREAREQERRDRLDREAAEQARQQALLTALISGQFGQKPDGGPCVTRNSCNLPGIGSFTNEHYSRCQATGKSGSSSELADAARRQQERNVIIHDAPQ